VRGFQCGIINIAENVKGVQFGLINYSRRLTGVQIGLINFNIENTVPFFPGILFGWNF
jgi:hypothetical protein